MIETVRGEGYRMGAVKKIAGVRDGAMSFELAALVGA